MTEAQEAHGAGPLFIIGGHEDRDQEGRRHILAAVAERLAGGKLVIATIASPSRTGYFEDYRAAFADLHEGELVELYLDQRSEADAPATRDIMEGARGIFFTGGNQTRLTTMVAGTAVEAWLKRLHHGGGLIAGTSAGASAMSATMLVSGDSVESGRRGAVEMAPGLGLVANTIIDQHFAQRGRMGRLVAALAAAPGSLGLGLDEDTAAVVENGQIRVMGSGAAYVLDAAELSYSDVAEVRAGTPITVHDMRLHVLGAGAGFDLVERQPLVPPERETDHR
ncbi:cyanophycinase [Erythrobacter donghaensis]|jgi:cyanophycinase|uniref:cyanophycinase n=1 Tax=Erythrobacter donghaensis TaxID=267135 RepID=UPI00093A6C63|nr:cyanophycinase [Erythrobacter donghaensis]